MIGTKTKAAKSMIPGVLVLALGFAISLANAPKGNAASSKKDNAVYAELAKAPKKAVARRNPLESDPDAVAAGANLFDQHCAECHGEMAEGGRKGPSLRADPVRQATPGTLFWILTNGVVRRGMPVWSKLPEPQRWQIVTYLKSLAPAEKPPR
jgi:mono/diheme cytochrome c family protein